MVSGTISLFCSKCFSPFLHSTGSLSVSREYLALPDGPGRFTQNSSCSALLRIPLGFGWLRIRSSHALWLYFPEHSAHQLSCHGVVLQPHPCRNMDGLGYSEIRGSKVICTYPQLIAAYHVLHRLREPRHPPCALTYFLSYRSRMVDIYFQLLTLLFFGHIMSKNGVSIIKQ